MSIFQPRLGSCSTWEVSSEDIERWAEEVLKPAAELAWYGNGDYKAGGHCGSARRSEMPRTRQGEYGARRHDLPNPPCLKTTK